MLKKKNPINFHVHISQLKKIETKVSQKRWAKELIELQNSRFSTASVVSVEI